MSVCAHCEIWPLHVDDVYCSWCHAKLMGYTVVLDREVLVLRESALSAWLTVTNLGQSPLEVQAITPSETWVQAPDVAGHALFPHSVPLAIELRILSTLLDPQRTYAATITVTMRDGSAPESVTLQVVPAPEVHVEIDSYTVILDDTASRPHSGRVILDKGAVHLLAPRASEPWLTVADNPPWPRLLAGPPGSELRFDLQSNAPLLRERLPRPYTPLMPFPVQLSFDGTEFEHPLEISVTITCSVPPQLQLEGLRGDTLPLRGFTGRVHDVTVYLENRGGLPLVVHEMAFDTAAPWLQVVPATRFPLAVEPGRQGALVLHLDGTALELGTYRTALTVLSNSYPVSRLDVPVLIQVDEMPVYDGVVAFDFGTTNSCAVVWDSDATAPRLIPLEPAQTIQDLLPSVIHYERLLADTRKEYRVGSQVKGREHRDPASTVSAIKRDIGQRTPRSVVFSLDGQRQAYLPEVIAQDIIAHMIRQVESHLGQQITSCVITHPSTFASSQLRALQQAFTKCGVQVEMTLHEPVAAALEYIFSPEQDHPASPYRLLVYDFGGGTTDITLLSVEDVRSDDGLREITPRVLGASGRQRFGGEDVTVKIAHVLCQQFTAWLLRNGTPYDVEADLPAIVRMDDPEARDRAQQNYPLICQLAETIKLEMAHEPEVASNSARSGTSPLLQILHDGRPMVVQPGWALTPEQFNALLKPEIESTLKIVDDLLQAAPGQCPDVILLSGQSSRLPLVRELFAQRFPPDRIRWAGQHPMDTALTNTLDELKACVARGACRVAAALRFPGDTRLNDTEMQPMATARLGLPALLAGRLAFKTVIAVGDPVGVPKPIKGILLARSTRLRVLEHTGSGDDLQSPDIQELGTYTLEQRLPSDITDRDMREARLAMELTKDYEVIVHIQIPGREPSSFICERWS